ncbi:MAG: tRNA (N6-isopentenyl adenosine(37)-C2)-methylthiotransferase MiaB, partial [Frankiaceae bacterium]|nr:tRNA (N6-isopentenyl adenosine(37)-C2)-methylthiotransferase MiaB [Frankiaceae bacterium]
ATEVLVAAGEGRKDADTGRVSGRARDGRLVHVAAGPGAPPAPGDTIRSTITRAAPHHLGADAPITARIPWRGPAPESEGHGDTGAATAGPRQLLTIARRRSG